MSILCDIVMFEFVTWKKGRVSVKSVWKVGVKSVWTSVNVG